MTEHPKAVPISREQLDALDDSKLVRQNEYGAYLIELDGPTTTRASVQFFNWDGFGMAITGPKLRADAAMFREAAGLVLHSNDQRAANLSVALRTLARQCEDAAMGHHPQAKVDG